MLNYLSLAQTHYLFASVFDCWLAGWAEAQAGHAKQNEQTENAKQNKKTLFARLWHGNMYIVLWIVNRWLRLMWMWRIEVVHTPGVSKRKMVIQNGFSLRRNIMVARGRLKRSWMKSMWTLEDLFYPVGFGDRWVSSSLLPSTNNALCRAIYISTTLPRCATITTNKRIYSIDR